MVLGLASPWPPTASRLIHRHSTQESSLQPWPRRPYLRPPRRLSGGAGRREARHSGAHGPEVVGLLRRVGRGARGRRRW
eukprot:5840210-Prymnesium_polylepis.1